MEHSSFCAVDDRPRPSDVFPCRKIAGRVCSGAKKRPRLEPDTEAARRGPSSCSSSPRCAAPPAGAASEWGRAVEVGSADEYEELCRIGAGAYGTVVKACHRVTGRTVAIKRLSLAEEEEGGDRDRDREEVEEEDLLREASFLASCAGVPFVVRFHGLVRDPDTKNLGLVMECAGPSIDAFLRHRHRIPEPTLRAVMWQLLTAAAGIHSRGVVHRDIKPENVLVANGLRAVKLCDFGLAVSASSTPPPRELAGTPGYRAPEVLLERPSCDARVDAWSIGCVMAEVVAGRSLFDAPEHPPDEEHLAILRVLGVPDQEAWSGFLDTPFAVDWMPELDLTQPSVLRELVPETALSDRGFEVLSGLLVCNPDSRLTAAAALELPWFADEDALEVLLPKKSEAASALPKEDKLLCV